MKYFAMTLFLSSILFSCSDEEDKKISIVGDWQGDRLEVKAAYQIVPIYSDTDENFSATLSFTEDGKVVYTKDNVESEGTYTIDGKELTTDADFDIYEFSGPVTFDIVELSETKLRLKLDETRPVTVPDYGEVPVTVTATLDFDRL
jgi:hypothetical protein